jgi:hypothetical protein
MTLRGHTFTLRDDVNPNVIILFDELSGTRSGEKTQAEQILIIDDVMAGLVMPEDQAAYREIRAGDDTPGLMELLAAAQWMIEEITNRPFEQPSASGTSPTSPPNRDSSTVAALRVQVGESGISASETG